MIDVNALIGGSPRLAPVAEYSLASATRELAAHGVYVDGVHVLGLYAAAGLARTPQVAREAFDL